MMFDDDGDSQKDVEARLEENVGQQASRRIRDNHDNMALSYIR